ncbi:MAG TPA: ABC transporter substrate-binding protein [Stellaceae bacterium]|nr:ABC transporter substrate-binding protein [Stellaceae bacterium]
MTTPPFRPILAALAGVCWLAAATPATAEVEHTTLTMPAITIGFLAEYIAEDLHLWEKHELDVKVAFIAGIGAMNAVISGSSDFSFSSGASITRAAAHGQKLLTIASLNNTSGEYVVLRKDLADAAHFDPNAPLNVRAQILKGRRFAIGGVNTISDAYLKVVAKEGGLRPDDVIVTPMQPPDMLSALSRNAIDGFSLGAPWAQLVTANGTGTIIANGNSGEPAKYTPFSSAILVTRPQFCVDRHSVCVKMGRGIAEAVDFAYEHRDESIALLRKRFTTLDVLVLAAAFDAVRTMLPRPPVTTVAGLVNADRMNEDAGFMKGEDELANYDALFDNQYVK